MTEYLALKERLKKRSLKERGQWMDRRRDLEENFGPVVASNKRMTKEIVDELTPITKELRELKDRAAAAAAPRQLATASSSSIAGVKRDIDSQPVSKQRRPLIGDGPDGPLAESFLEKYMDHSRNSQIDKTFGIRFEKRDGWMIGNKHININGDDSIMDEVEVYDGTPGLLSLITDKSPSGYTGDDLGRYKELLHETSAMHQHYDSRDPYPRASGGKKWKNILTPIWNEFQLTGVVSPSANDADSIDGALVNRESNDDYSDSDNDSNIIASNTSNRNMDDDDDDDDDDYFHSASEDGEWSKKGNGVKMYLQKDGRCFHLQKSGVGVGRGMTLTPRPRLAGVRGDGLYLRVGSSIYDGHGLILGPSSPFKNIPILGWIL